jgi:uncharacterized protein (DUF58 family)
VLSRRGLEVSAGGAVLAVAGVALGVEEFVLAAAAAGCLLVLGAAVLAWQLGAARAGAEVRLGPLPAEVGVGDEATVALVLANAGRRALAVLGAEELSWGLSYPGLARRPPPAPSPEQPARRWRAVRLVPSTAAVLAPGDHIETSVALPTEARGVRSLGAVVLWCGDPLGLVRWPLLRELHARVVVVRRPPPAGADGLGSPGRPEPVPSSTGAAAQAEGTDEFAGLRAYVPGDRLTRVDWPASTRSGRLLVRQFVEAPAPGCEIVVDTRPWRIEDSVAEAAARGLAELGRGRPVTLRTGGGDWLELAPGPQARLGLLRALAAVGPAPASRSVVLRRLAAGGRGSR